MPDGDHVLGHVPHRVRGRAVDLGRVLAAERAAAVAGHAAVGVDDDLAAGEPAVGVRTAELERAGRVARAPRSRRSANCSGTVGLITCSMRSLRICPSMSMPGACWLEMSTVDSATGPAVVVDDAHLGLAVGPQVVEQPFLAHRGEAAGEPVREPDRHRHEVVGVVAGVPEHHPLVARAHLVVVVGETVADLLRLVDALGDVGRLLVDRRDRPRRCWRRSRRRCSSSRCRARCRARCAGSRCRPGWRSHPRPR